MDYNDLIKCIEFNNYFIEVSRINLEEYPGICRRIFAMGKKIRIDYVDYTFVSLEEGEESFYFTYECYNDLIKSLKTFTKNSIKYYNDDMEKWEFLDKDTNRLNMAWEDFWRDLKNHTLQFPQGFCFFSIRTLFAKAIYLGLVDEINISDYTFLNTHREEITSSSQFYNY